MDKNPITHISYKAAICNFFQHVLICGFTTCISICVANAQTAVCRRIGEQIAALDRQPSDPGRAAQINRQAEAQSSEANRISNQMRRMGCNEQSLLMGSDLPGDCGLMANQLRSYRENAIQLRTEAVRETPGSSETRRDALISSYANYGCDQAQARSDPYGQRARRNDSRSTIGTDDMSGQSSVTILPPRPANPYGSSYTSAPGYDDTDPDALVLPPARQRGFGGLQPVCVRLCDGFFFPLSGASSREGAQEMCQAQCPAAPARVFYRNSGADVGEASDEDGRTYSSLPTALKYRTKMDQTCTCRKAGESWAATLKPAEEKVSGETGDVTVTEKSADEIAKGKSALPKSVLPKPEVKQPEPKKKAARAAPSRNSEDDFLSGIPLRGQTPKTQY